MRPAGKVIRASAGIAALAATMAVPGPAAAAAPPQTRTTGLVRKDGRLFASVGVPDLFGAEERRRLGSGFVSRVLVRVFLTREGDTQPVVRAFQAGEIAYDLWDEKFQVKMTGPSGPVVVTAPTADEAIHRATSLWQFPLVFLSELDPGARYRIAFRADLNPISDELVAEVRRFLVRPPGGQRRPGPGDSFFGSFVSIFVNPRIEDSERRIIFVSQSFRPRDVR